MNNRPGNLASEKVLFKAAALIMLLIPVSEVITDILCNFTDQIIPSMFQTGIVALFGIISTVLVFLNKGFELKGAETGNRWYAADVIYLVLVLFMILSAVFSVNPGVFTDGDFFVCENPLHFMAYFSLFYFGSRIKTAEYRKKLVILFLVIALLQGVISFFQTFDIEIAYCLPTRHSGAAYGLTQNSNFYGGLSVFLLACITGAFLFCEKICKQKVFLCLLPLLAGLVFYTMMGSRARLAWIGFAAMVLFYVVSGIVMLKSDVSRDDLKTYFIRLAVVFAVFAAVFTLTHLFTNFWIEEIQRTQWEIDGTYEAGLGSDRLLNWRFGLESIPRHWLTGIGLDNYSQVFYESPKYVAGAYAKTKAHNEYLHIMATQGVFAFAAYITLYFRTAVVSVKRIFKGADSSLQSVDWILLAMFVTYAAQAFFNCSVVNVAMYFWLVMGLLNPCEKPLGKSDKSNK